MCDLKCLICKSEIKASGKKFCSHECYYKWNRIQKKIRDIRKRKGIKEYYDNCKHCNKVLKDKSRQFCDKECYLNNRTGKLSICKECGKSFRLKDRVFCDIDCMIKFKARDPKTHYSRPRSEEWKKQHSEFMQKNTFGFQKGGTSHNKGKKMQLTPEWLENIRKHLKRLNESGFENKGGKCSWFIYKDIVVQGRYELYFLMNNFDSVDINHPKKPFRTPFGLYTPDFKMKDGYFVEVKSVYTLKLYAKSKQRKKVEWLLKNEGLMVKIKILQEKNVYRYLRDNADEFESYVPIK